MKQMTEMKKEACRRNVRRLDRKYSINVGKKLKFLREMNDLSQQDIASMLGVTQSAVYMWEKSANMPTLKTLIYLSFIYGFPTPGAMVNFIIDTSIVIKEDEKE